MSARPKPRKPVTASDVEGMMDKLAWLMSKSKTPHLGVPLWDRLERELERLRAEEATVARAMERLRRSPDRTEARSA
jgi:hypothetical protein